MIMRDLRVDPDGNVAQYFPESFRNDPRKWLVMRIVDGDLMAFVYADDEVRDWPRLTVTPTPPVKSRRDEAVELPPPPEDEA